MDGVLKTYRVKSELGELRPRVPGAVPGHIASTVGPEAPTGGLQAVLK